MFQITLLLSIISWKKFPEIRSSRALIVSAPTPSNETSCIALKGVWVNSWCLWCAKKGGRKIIISPMTGCGRRVAEHLTNSLFMSVAGDESWRVHLQCVHSCEACLDLAEPIPLQVRQQLMSPDLKARLGHGYVAIDSIRKTHHPVHWLQSWKPFAERCHHRPGNTACVPVLYADLTRRQSKFNAFTVS